MKHPILQERERGKAKRSVKMSETHQLRERGKAWKRERSSLREERKLWKKGYKRVACLDEAGRGSLGGPVVAAAAMINLKLKAKSLKPQLRIQNRLKEIKDSKKLSPKKREEFYKILTNPPCHPLRRLADGGADGGPNIKWGIGKVSEKVIDKINIKNAAELAMERALRNLEKKMAKKADFLIIDGNRLKNHKLKTKNYKLIVRADEKVFSCAVASIIAKVTRDRIMKKYHQKYPQYRFDKHKGYCTKYHLKMLKKHKSCSIHRKTFSPVLKNL